MTTARCPTFIHFLVFLIRLKLYRRHLSDFRSATLTVHCSISHIHTNTVLVSWQISSTWYKSQDKVKTR